MAVSKLSPEQMAHRYLLAFARYQYPHYKIARHNATIAKKLQEVESGEITRLMIFTPPRHGKTMLISEFFPAWYLGRNPTKQIIATSYSSERGLDVGRKVRDLLVDPRYANIFPNSKVNPNSKSAKQLSLLQGGNYFSVGIGGAVTGRGADVLIIDDPIKGREDAESDSAQSKMRDWFTSVAYTRLMPGRSAIILVMTRWSYYDLAGWLLDEKKSEGWEVLNMPALAEDEDDFLGRQPKDALWPEAY